MKQFIFSRTTVLFSLVLSGLLGIAISALAGNGAAQNGAGSSPQVVIELEKGQPAMKVGDMAAAAQAFRVALQLAPENVEANANLGAIALLAGRCVEAEPQLRDALHIEPTLRNLCAGSRIFSDGA